MTNTKPDSKSVAMQTLSRQGRSVRKWAKHNGVSASLVLAVISGKNPARINKGHKVAVLLGIKDGEIIEN